MNTRRAIFWWPTDGNEARDKQVSRPISTSAHSIHLRGYPMPRRVDRINVVLREEISQLLSRQIKDPRLRGVISITHVITARDLRTAEVYVSVMGDEETKRLALDGIQSAATFLRRELRDRLTLRHTPFLKFSLDESLEQADQVLHLMDQINEDHEDHHEPGPSDGAKGRQTLSAFPPDGP